MTKPTDAASVNDDNYIPIDGDKLKEDKKKSCVKLWKNTSVNASSYTVLPDLVM